MPTPADLYRAQLDAAFLLIPGVQRVGVQTTDPDTGAVAAKAAVPGKRSAARVAWDGPVPVTRCRWRLRAADLGGRRPRLKDRVVEADGTAWVVDAVATACLQTRYVCECTQA